MLDQVIQLGWSLRSVDESKTSGGWGAVGSQASWLPAGRIPVNATWLCSPTWCERLCSPSSTTVVGDRGAQGALSRSRWSCAWSPRSRAEHGATSESSCWPWHCSRPERHTVLVAGLPSSCQSRWWWHVTPGRWWTDSMPSDGWAALGLPLSWCRSNFV